MMCDLPNETESLHELQIAEATVIEMNDDTTETANTLEQPEPKSGLNLIKKADDDSTYSLVADVGPENPTIIDDVAVTDEKKFKISLPEWTSSQNDDISATVGDEIMPVYEGFIIDEEVGNTSIENAENRVDFDMFEIPSTTIARASILEQICKSASMQKTPLSQFPSTLNLYESMADGIFEHMYVEEDSRKHLQISESEITEIDSVFQNQQKFKFDSLSFSSTPFIMQSKNHYSSPVGKCWERSASSSGSSEKQLSSNPELTCFPIEEDPSSDEESENDIVGRKDSDEVAVEKEIKLCSQQANPVSISMKYQDRCSSNSVNFSVPKTRDQVRYKPKNNPGIKVSRFEENNRASSIVTCASAGNRGNLSEFSTNKSVIKSGITRLSQKEPKRNNIVSNITSFVPIVQQKQAASVCPVKRDIKVKALEAAEAAKRREQEKEIKRKMKKEALKLERARLGKENAREMELNKIKKQEELKKKEVRKRQREEDEKKLACKQRKLIAEAQKNHKIQSVKQQQGKNAAIAGNKKGSESVRKNNNNNNADKNSFQKQETELRTQFASVPEKVTIINEKSPVKVGPSKLTSQENSYDISPYQSSDDEDDDEEDEQLPTKKFVPLWASKSRVAMVLPLQLKLNPETIFTIDSFCSMDEVLLPRNLHAQ